jgi:acyl-CoA thioesterase
MAMSSGTIPARFGLIWFSGFRGEYLNVIFYQNMPNLHNRYKSAERNIWWVPFKIVSDSPALHSTWLLLLKKLKCLQLSIAALV